MCEEIDSKALQTLTHFNDIYWQQFRYHREKEYRIFVWTSAILLAGIAGLLVTKQGELPVYVQYGICGQVVATLVVLGWLGASVWMQKRERKSGNSYITILVNIATKLGAFDPERPTCVLPNNWSSWKDTPQTGFQFNFVPITCLVGVIAVGLVWLPRLG